MATRPGFTKNENTPVKESKVRAYVNWVALNRAGEKSPLKSERGFVIFNPDAKYPNAAEDKLVKFATQNGGSVTLMMEVRVTLAAARVNTDELDLADFAY